MTRPYDKAAYARWYRDNRAAKVEAVRQIGFELRLETLSLLGSKCRECGYDKDLRALHVDHVNDNGADERRRIGMGNVLRKYIRDQILAGSKEYQLLCANCNLIKGADRKGVKY